MTPAELGRAVPEATSEATPGTDPATQHLRLASRHAAVIREQGMERVVLGGSTGKF